MFFVSDDEDDDTPFGGSGSASEVALEDLNSETETPMPEVEGEPSTSNIVDAEPVESPIADTDMPDSHPAGSDVLNGDDEEEGDYEKYQPGDKALPLNDQPQSHDNDEEMEAKFKYLRAQLSKLRKQRSALKLDLKESPTLNP